MGESNGIDAYARIKYPPPKVDWLLSALMEGACKKYKNDMKSKKTSIVLFS